jgi:uncharacterized membrane protein
VAKIVVRLQVAVLTQHDEDRRARIGKEVARIAASGLAFLWLTLEIRHVFRGEVLTWGECGEAEWYVYSAAWLAFAGAGLAAGLKWRKDWLRRASLAGVGLVVAKVFISDMAALGGVLRALSFLGLGGALVGIGKPSGPQRRDPKGLRNAPHRNE